MCRCYDVKFIFGEYCTEKSRKGLYEGSGFSGGGGGGCLRLVFITNIYMYIYIVNLKEGLAVIL